MKKYIGILLALLVTSPLYATVCPNTYVAKGKEGSKDKVYTFYSASFVATGDKVVCTYGTQQDDGTFSDMHFETINNVKSPDKSKYWQSMRQHNFDYNVCYVHPKGMKAGKNSAGSADDCKFFLKKNEKGERILIK